MRLRKDPFTCTQMKENIVVPLPGLVWRCKFTSMKVKEEAIAAAHQANISATKKKAFSENKSTSSFQLGTSGDVPGALSVLGLSEVKAAPMTSETNQPNHFRVSISTLQLRPVQGFWVERVVSGPVGRRSINLFCSFACCFLWADKKKLLPTNGKGWKGSAGWILTLWTWTSACFSHHKLLYVQICADTARSVKIVRHRCQVVQ